MSLFASASLVFAPLNVSAANAVEVELSLVKDIYIGSDDGLEDEEDGEAGAFVGSTYFFPANDGTNGFELWKSDGTEAGTVLVKNIRAGSSNSRPSKLTAVGSTLYFTASDGTHGRELWKSDGTEAGTVIVKDIGEGVDEDGDPESGNLDDLIAVGSTLYFSANDRTNGDEFWKSDGTEAGTVMVKNIRTGSDEDNRPYSGDPENMTAVGTTVYFRANDGTNGYELWKSDGTAGGTVMVKNIRAGSSNGDPLYLTAVGNTLYFSAYGPFGRELWKSDGTEAGTVMVKDILIEGDSGPEYLTAVGNTLYFSAQDGTHGRELWKSDGTEAGTVMVKDILIGGDSGPEYLTAVGNTLYFSANDGTNGLELWKSDGTEAGTVMVKDIDAGVDCGGGPCSSAPKNLTAVGNTLYFSAYDNANGEELWKSDGTGTGTSMVENINPSVGAGSTPIFFSASASTLFFWADNGTVGRELWTLRSLAPSVTTPPTTEPEALATTGTTSSNYLALVPLLLALGGLLVWLGRGRRSASEPQ